MERCSQVLNEANTTKVRLLMRLRDTTLSVILRLSASRSWPPRFRYSMGPTTASPGGQGEATGRGERWGGWFGREIARQNQISFRRRRVWTIEQPSGQRPIWLSRQPILPVITLLAALSLSRPPLGAHAAPSSNGRCFLAFLISRVAKRAKRAGEIRLERNPFRENVLPRTCVGWLTPSLLASMIELFYGRV